MMNKVEMIYEQSPLNVSHETYRRECRYTRGVHIGEQDFKKILSKMPEDCKMYFDFHNSFKEIKKGVYLNGHSGLARYIQEYFRHEKNTEIIGINNRKDFYVKII